MRWVGVVLSNGDLAVSLRENNLFSQQQLELFVDLHGTLLANSSIGYNLVPVVEASFGEKRWPYSAPSVFGDFIRITCICYRKFPLH